MTLRPNKLPLLIVITGIPGTGKTWLADLLSASHSIPHIDYDAVCQPFLRSIRKQYEYGLELEDFHRKWRREAYQAVIEIIIQNLRNNVSLITSAPFSKEISDTNYFAKLRRLYDIDFVAISFHLRLPKEKILENIKQRGDSRDNAKIQLWNTFYEEKAKSTIEWDADFYFEPNLINQIPPLLQIENFLMKNNLQLK